MYNKPDTLQGHWQRCIPEVDSPEWMSWLWRDRGARLGAGPRLCTVVSNRSAGTRLCGCRLPGLSSSKGIYNTDLTVKKQASLACQR